jgi:broad specificity phosphatase PhoE
MGRISPLGLDYCIHESESSEDFSTRNKLALEKVRLKTVSDAVAISHSGFLLGMIKYVLPSAKTKDVTSCNHAGLSTFSYMGGVWCLDKCNDIDYLSKDILPRS